MIGDEAVNRSERRLSDRNGARLQKLAWNNFEEISKIELREKSETFLKIEGRRTWDKVWKNNRYFVFMTKNERVWLGWWWSQVMIKRCDSQPIYSWSDVFRIKNELFGDETEAIQFFPKKSELVDSANIYWFFIKTRVDL